MNQKNNFSEYSTFVRLVVDGDGTYFLASHPEIENCFSDGKTMEEALGNLGEVTEMVLEHLRVNNLPIPSPRPLGSDPGDLIQRRAQPLKDQKIDSPTIEFKPILA